MSAPYHQGDLDNHETHDCNSNRDVHDSHVHTVMSMTAMLTDDVQNGMENRNFSVQYSISALSSMQTIFVCLQWSTIQRLCFRTGTIYIFGLVWKAWIRAKFLKIAMLM
jgi:hypothetical protein